MFMLRNDMVAVDTDPHFFSEFLKLCDHFNVKVLHAIAPIGRVQGLEQIWDNTQLTPSSGSESIGENPELLRQLLRRRDRDLFGIDGLLYVHQPTVDQIERGRDFVEKLGLPVTHFIPPFDAGAYEATVCGLKLLQRCPALKRYHNITPDADDAIECLLAIGVASVAAWRCERGKLPGTLGMQTLDTIKHMFSVLSANDAGPGR
jgi:hypothetical protein